MVFARDSTSQRMALWIRRRVGRGFPLMDGGMDGGAVVCRSSERAPASRPTNRSDFLELGRAQRSSSGTCHSPLRSATIQTLSTHHDWRNMNRTTLLILVAAVLAFVIGGCATADPNTSLQVSGTPGIQFTAEYRTGEVTGSVNTVTPAERRTTVFDMPGRGLAYDVSKKDPAAHLSVEIRQADRPVFRADAPTGTLGIRVWQTTNGWRQERY